MIVYLSSLIFIAEKYFFRFPEKNKLAPVKISIIVEIHLATTVPKNKLLSPK